MLATGPDYESRTPTVPIAGNNPGRLDATGVAGFTSRWEAIGTCWHGDCWESLGTRGTMLACELLGATGGRHCQHDSMIQHVGMGVPGDHWRSLAVKGKRGIMLATDPLYNESRTPTVPVWEKAKPVSLRRHLQGMGMSPWIEADWCWDLNGDPCRISSGV